MNKRLMITICIFLSFVSSVHGGDQNRLPDDIPPLTGKAIARPKEKGDWNSGWTIALTLPRDTWRSIQVALPKLDWPEPTWKKIRPGMSEGTLTLVGDTMPTQFKVVDMNGKQLGRNQVVKLLKSQEPVLVSVSGQVPRDCYRRLPTTAKLIVLLGSGKGTALADAKVASDRASDNQEDVLKDWTEENSKKYFFELMQKSTKFKIKSEEEASKYLRGIWRLDKRAHIGGGHYVRADRGEDITFICTDKWLVMTALNGTVSRDMDVARVNRVELDDKGHLHLKATTSITYDHIKPLDKDHMAVLAYDFIAVVKRIPCETTESQNGAGNGGKLDAQPFLRVPSDRVSAMAGTWKINSKFDGLLGAPERENQFPKSLKLSFAAPGAPVLNKKTIALIEDMFVKRMKHTIIGVGKWQAEKDSKFASDRDSNCFVTTQQGATYLWFGTPDKSLFGVQVHHVRLGKKSLLILDGNSILPPSLFKTKNVIGYSSSAN